jgi:Bacterial SH3 domain
MKKQTLTTLIALLLLGAACAPSPSLPRDDQLATIVALTLTAQPFPTTAPTFIPTSTAAGLPTAGSPPLDTPSGPYYINTVVQNVNLRTQPGTLFPVSRVMPQGTRLQVLGLSPGGEWVYVLNEEGIQGWVGVQVVDEFPLEAFPSVEPSDVTRLTGRVLDPSGLPVSGIGYAIGQQTASKSLRTDAVTDATGTFYAYLPQNATGLWTVSFVSVACTSNSMDANCNCLEGMCGTSYPESATVSLPAHDPLVFTWK